jgi:hypothetical protein
MKRVIVAVSITLTTALTFGLVYFLSAHSYPSMVGVWKGTDEYGHEHYYDFHKDGTLTWWDRDRHHDGSFEQRGPFRGWYKFEDRRTIVATQGDWAPPPLGMLAPSLGTLTMASENLLKQDDYGPAMRKNLVYRRITSE